MKIELFTPVTYYGENLGLLTPPRLSDPGDAQRSIENAFREFEVAHEHGFDSLNVAEHHYFPHRMTPEPAVFAAALGQRIPDATIGVQGPIVTTNNPIRVAETYALLDNVLGGRLGAVALLRGSPGEYLTYGTNPWDSKEALQEAVLLIKRAWTEPEPFGWEGRYHRHRQVAVWPRVVQQPHPRIVLSGNSESSARFAGSTHSDLGFSYITLEGVQRGVAAYREAAAEAGWTPTADNILFRQSCYVAETDAEAHRHAESYDWPAETKALDHVGPSLLDAVRLAAAGMAGVPKGVTPDMSKAPVGFGTPWLGGPETVLEEMREFAEQTGVGRFEVIIASGQLPHEHVCRAIELIGEVIVPAFQAEPASAVAAATASGAAL